jgi:Tfp pilus assembly protein PilN
MRIPINLAHEPFRQNRRLLVGSTIAGLLLIASLVFLMSLSAAERRETRDTQAILSRVNRQLTAIRAEQAKLDTQMRRPGNEVALDRIVLLNELIKLKATSWTKIFSDLEKVVPPNVRILSIRPSINSRDEVFLDMQVAADGPEQFIAFVKELEGSDVFGSTAISGITPPSQTDAFYRYRLSVNYAQKL